jgi:hypothetical protein
MQEKPGVQRVQETGKPRKSFLNRKELLEKALPKKEIAEKPTAAAGSGQSCFPFWEG